jgi:'Cold-shock' DNA-binding domain
LDYEVDEGKKLFFHMTEVQGSSYNLYPGDTVEFSIITNHVMRSNIRILVNDLTVILLYALAYWQDIGLWSCKDSRLFTSPRTFDFSYQN